MTSFFNSRHIGRVFSAAALGSLLGVGLFWSHGWIVAPVVFAGFLATVKGVDSFKEAFGVGFAFGFGVVGVSLSWGFGALPFDWLGIFNPKIGIAFAIGLWLFFTSSLALPTALFALVLYAYRSASKILFFIPVLWVLSEIGRSLFASIAVFGRGSGIGLDLTFGYFGYVISWSDGILWAARLFGVLGLSFLGATIGTILFALALRSDRKSLLLGGLLYVAFIATGYFPSPVVYTQDASNMQVGGLTFYPVETFVGPALSRPLERVRREEIVLVEDVRAAVKSGADVVLLPEYSRLFQNEHLLSAENVQTLRAQLRESEVLVIDSQKGSFSEKTFARTLFFDGAAGEVSAVHSKRFLSPFGEYLPYTLEAVLRLSGMSIEADSLLTNKSTDPSTEPFKSRTFLWKGVTIGVLSCSEILSPFSYWQLSRGGADVLLHIASYAWLRDRSEMLYLQTFAMARVHAAFTQKPFIQATNFGPSFALIPAFKK